MVTAVTMVKDEADIIETTIRHMLTQVDRVIVADNNSTDGTTEILQSLPVDYVHDPDPAYYQADKMTRLANMAMGSDWVIPFDADEIWIAAEGTLAEALAALDPEARVAEAKILDHMTTAVDPDGRNPVESIPWRRVEALPLRKVAFRPDVPFVIRQGNHSVEFQGIPHPLTVTDTIEIRHFPYRSAAQMISKARNGAAAYAATSFDESIGAHWRSYGRTIEEQGEAALASHYLSAFHCMDPENDPIMVYDPCPLRS